MTKKEKTQMCQTILHKYPIYSDLGWGRITNQGEHDMLLHIFQNHPEWQLKKGVGIDFISVTLTSWKTRCFQLHRVDGTTTDISYKACITKKHPAQIFIEACRNAVREDIHRFRMQNVIYGVTTCEITGETLTRDNTHIDHYDMDFKTLLKNFWYKYFSHVKLAEFVDTHINKTDDNSVDTCFIENVWINPSSDDEMLMLMSISECFRQFHNENTQLRAVTKDANLSLLKRKVADED